MILTKYKEKRNFNKSPEPEGGSPDIDKLRFVIQKHAASRLHYDLRLEMDGVLKSWAVPKGPSTDPSIKRLAIMVEDHPYDYRNFEGIIPGGYGAGTVMVWDEGIYAMADANGRDKKNQDTEMQKGIHAGKLHFELHGHKLKGEYALVKTNGKGENSWLLFKVKDKHVSKEDITLKDKSVLSKKTLEQLERTSASSSKKAAVNGKKGSPTNKSSDINAAPSKNKKETESPISMDQVLSKGKKAKFPTSISPMLAVIVDQPFDKAGWQYEIKWDGYRAVAFCNKGAVALKSRNDNSFREKFPPIVDALEQWNIDAVIDGEIVVINAEGKPDFGALQNWRSEADGEIFFYAFDLIWMNDRDLMQVPLNERRIILKQIMPENSILRFSENFEVDGKAFFESAKELGLEGIMAKRADSIYSTGKRTHDWLKIKANKTQEMVIGAYTKNDNSSKSFSSLLLGFYENGKLIYKGKVGTGFTDKQQIEMLQLFKPYIIKTPAFEKLPNINKASRFQPKSSIAQVTWMKPELVCEVSYTEMTIDGVMRHPSFKAMRMDKKARDIRGEEEIATKEILSGQKSKSKTTKISAGAKACNLFNPDDKTKVLEINGNAIKFTNLNKIYWPVEKIDKRDMLSYYHQIAPYILPYLKDRPQSMNRHPNGINGKSFYFKNVSGTAPDWVETFDYKSDSDSRTKKYLVAINEASLLYMATLGCIEMNPWHSKVETADYPDWCIIDLDPADNTFQQVIEAANVTKDILESMGVVSYPKTSGSTGIHIYIPLGAKYTYDQSKEFARVIATLVHREIPKYTSIERNVKARKGKMYLDFLQNRAHATVAAPYSLRPKPGATVSMPLRWDEVKKGLKMSDFTMYNALERIQSVGDIFKPVLGEGINLANVVKKFNK